MARLSRHAQECVRAKEAERANARVSEREEREQALRACAAAQARGAWAERR
jgi:hypothetical protein